MVVAENGIETNIGNVCGKRIFGVVFTELNKRFTQETNAQRYREKITATINQLPAIQSKIDSLREGNFGADNSLKKMHWQISKGFELATLDALKSRSKRKGCNTRDSSFRRRTRNCFKYRECQQF